MYVASILLNSEDTGHSDILNTYAILSFLFIVSLSDQNPPHFLFNKLNDNKVWARLTNMLHVLAAPKWRSYFSNQ